MAVGDWSAEEQIEAPEKADLWFPYYYTCGRILDFYRDPEVAYEADGERKL